MAKLPDLSEFKRLTQDIDSITLNAGLTKRAFDKDLKHINAIVGKVFPTKSEFFMPNVSIADTVRSICSEFGVKVVDLSDKVNPNMKICELALVYTMMFQRMMAEPNTMFIFTCDELNAIECIDAIACHFVPFSISSIHGVPPQAILYHGEDFFHVRNVRSDTTEIRQGIHMMLDEDIECPVCLEKMSDVQAQRMDLKFGKSSFACGHMLCAKCHEEEAVKFCPICRCDKRPEIVVKMMQQSMQDNSKKGNKSGKKKKKNGNGNGRRA